MKHLKKNLFRLLYEQLKHNLIIYIYLIPITFLTEKLNRTQMSQKFMHYFLL